MNAGSSDLAPWIFIPLALVFIVVSLTFFKSRSRAMLEQWAADNKFTILNSEFRSFFRGPFFWRASKHQAIYYVTIREASGRERIAWVCCGSFFWGVWTKKTSVIWDDEK